MLNLAHFGRGMLVSYAGPALTAESAERKMTDRVGKFIVAMIFLSISNVLEIVRTENEFLITIILLVFDASKENAFVTNTIHADDIIILAACHQDVTYV